jgi:hypothetical protein
VDDAATLPLLLQPTLWPNASSVPCLLLFALSSAA